MRRPNKPALIFYAREAFGAAWGCAAFASFHDRVFDRVGARSKDWERIALVRWFDEKPDSAWVELHEGQNKWSAYGRTFQSATLSALAEKRAGVR